LLGNSSNAAGDWSLTLPDDIIADSARAEINVIGEFVFLSTEKAFESRITEF